MLRAGDRVRLSASADRPLPWEIEGTVEHIAPDGAVYIEWPYQGRVRYTYRAAEELIRVPATAS